MSKQFTLMTMPGLGLSARKPIVYWDRTEDEQRVEKVYGDALVRLIYSSGPAGVLADLVFANRWFSKAVGIYQSSNLSTSRIADFVSEYKIPMEEYEPGPFASF